MVRRGSSVQVRSEAGRKKDSPNPSPPSRGQRTGCKAVRRHSGEMFKWRQCENYAIDRTGAFLLYFDDDPIGSEALTDRAIQNTGKDRSGWPRLRGNRLSSLLYSVPNATAGTIQPARTRGISRGSWSSTSTASLTENTPCTGKPR